MPSNYFGTDCPVTFHMITEIRPFWDRVLPWPGTSKRGQHPCSDGCLRPSRQLTAEVLSLRHLKASLEGGGGGRWSILSLALLESSGNRCRQCLKRS